MYPIGIYAYNKVEALGKSVIMSREKFLVKEAWYDIYSDVVEITELTAENENDNTR